MVEQFGRIPQSSEMVVWGQPSTWSACQGGVVFPSDLNLIQIKAKLSSQETTVKGQQVETPVLSTPATWRLVEETEKLANFTSLHELSLTLPVKNSCWKNRWTDRTR